MSRVDSSRPRAGRAPDALDLMGNAPVADPLWKCVTLAIVLTGIPIYYVFFGKGTKNV